MQPEGGEQLLLLRAHLLDVMLAHLFEAAHVLWQARDLDRDVEIARVEVHEELIEGGLVVAAELLLEAAVGGAAEQVQRGAAQELEPRQHGEEG